MKLSELCAHYHGQSTQKALIQLLKQSHSLIHLQGLSGSAAALNLSSISDELRRPLLFALNDYEEAGYFYQDLCQILGEDRIHFFPSSYKRAVKYGQIDSASQLLRTEAFGAIMASPERTIIVTYPDALVERVASSSELEAQSRVISKGDQIDLHDIADDLFRLGFERVDYVYEPGQYAVRGGILDLYSYSNELPYRLDFFGSEIDSIRTFRVETQLSVEQTDQITVILDSHKKPSGGISFLEFIPRNTLLFVRDLSWLAERVKFIVGEGVSLQAVQSDNYDELLPQRLIDSSTFLRDMLEFQRINFGTRTYGTPQATLPFQTQAQPIFHKNFDLVGDTIRQFQQEGYTIYILSDSEKQTERLRVIFEERGDNIRFVPVLKTLHEGFIDHASKNCFFTDHQIFDRFHKYNLKSESARSGKLALSLKELMQFEIGDYVVHINHGVGKFGGLAKQQNGGKVQEMIKLIYQNDDLVFVSIHALHKLSKFRSKEGEVPRLNKLGSGAWEKIKEKTKSKVKDIARDLIKLYAERRQEQGFAYSPDTYLQQELEASFVYEDTPDQLKSTADVKQDMERIRPMDRLICGDVGFGKTEIAIRAAFKAATDGKQTAVLVPTTVLAFQHFKSFSERLKEFPCKVDYVSRARKPSDIKRILAELKEGKIDILIGTHRLVSKDISFKDLGLLIIDEEQKFGVSIKEKLRQMKQNVDTLTMSATPIPRTLQFSLVGARDLSVIQTPPPNRYPIQTEIHLYNDDIFREAINFELSRNGQVFIVNNRIESLTTLQNMVNRTVPDARVRIGHGQMLPEELEQIIVDFQNQEFDVLIATTIIESGIDIPNANTIIVNAANHYGLSELHQLRGRVGRSNRKAFCYLIAPSLSLLPPEARRRLQAIENFSDLGSGIHIAMQDLDIRGAGNLLGAEQSGFIADLGYETYQKILHEAVAELKTEEFAELYADEAKEELDRKGEYEFVDDTQIETDLEVYLSGQYVPNDSERILLYRELDGLERDENIEAFRKRLKDRFGKLPQEAEELVRISPLRRIAKSLGVERLALKNERMTLYLVSDSKSPFYQSPAFEKLIKYMVNHPRACEAKEKNGRRILTIKPIKRVETALNLLIRIQKGED